ncbi:hypothetical protein [Candidatus Soleaferrea massiliensis]|uniref:hypothetical protein n=1 Tax=Candidatus Soleaferrea massiliensis TaxID=1470354 RepID=UPI00058F9D6E|nr:hypothetical protein [Candidatus Soleaferrea massiliensis]
MKTEKSELLQLQYEQWQLSKRIQQLYDDVEELNNCFIALLESDLDVCPWCRPLDVGYAHIKALSSLEHVQHHMECARNFMFIPGGGEAVPLSVYND